MTRIDDLIAEHCPEGVEFKTLGEIGSLYGGLTGKSKKDFTDGNARFVSYVNVFKNGATDLVDDNRVHVGPNERQNKVLRGDVLFTTSSENIEEVGMSSTVTAEPDGDLYLNSFCFGFRLADPGLLLPEFSKHLLRAPGIRCQIVRTANGVTRFNISKKRFAEVKVPLPPPAIQREIAEILSKLEKVEAELEVALEDELGARRDQHEHYRVSLLSFPEGVARATLGELVSFINGKPHERLVDADGDVALMTARFISTQGKAPTRFVRGVEVLTPATDGDIALVMSDLPNGRALARAFFVDTDGRYAANQRVCLLRVVDETYLLPRFLYHVVNRDQQLLRHDNGQDQTHLSKGQILSIDIPVPSLEQQERIVATLDKFDALVSDISVGLPAEIGARRQQYEFYRDRLLTFEEKAQ